MPRISEAESGKSKLHTTRSLRSCRLQAERHFGRTYHVRCRSPGFRSLPHHHGEAETGAYVLSGRARIFFGKDYQEYIDLAEGEFMFVPPLLPHLEVNMSTAEELWWLACRSPENIVVNLPDVDDAMLAGYRRA